MKTKTIDATILYELITKILHEEDGHKGYKFIENNLVDADMEDGGGDFEMVIQEIESGKFFIASYSQWDIENTDYNKKDGVCGRCDLDLDLCEVVPVTKTIIVYEPI